MNPKKLFRGHIRYSNNHKVCTHDKDSSCSHNILNSHNIRKMGSSYSRNIRKMDIHYKMGMAPRYNKEQEYIPRTPLPKEAKLLK
jgi:hypothetical protein